MLLMSLFQTQNCSFYQNEQKAKNIMSALSSTFLVHNRYLSSTCKILNQRCMLLCHIHIHGYAIFVFEEMSNN